VLWRTTNSADGREQRCRNLGVHDHRTLLGVLFARLKQVALLFAGIFATMMPALDWPQANAGRG